jgi:hypothetical protein
MKQYITEAKRFQKLAGIIKEDFEDLPEIFNIEPKDAANIFSTDEDPTSAWNQIQDELKNYKQQEDILKIPYKNITLQGSNSTNIFLFKDNKPIVYAHFNKFNDGLQSKYITKSKSANISNLGVMLYEAVVNNLKLPVYSDLQQTEASKKGIWSKLFQKYPERVVAYNIKTKKISKMTNPKDNEFEPQVDNNPIYGNKYKGVKINTWGEEHPDNQVVDWEPGGIDVFSSSDFPLDKVFQEKNLYLLKFLPA